MRYKTALILIFMVVVMGGNKPANAQYILGDGFYNWDNPAISYPNHTWMTVVDANNYFGSRRSSGQTTSTNPEIVFRFLGTAFTFFTIRNNIQTDINLCVNSVCNYLSLFLASGIEYGHGITVSGLAYAVHTVSIKKAVTTNTALNIDAIFIHPSLITPSPPIINITMVYPTAQPTPIPQPTPTGTQGVWVLNMPEETPESTPAYLVPIEIAGQPSAINYTISPLDVVIIVMLGFITIVMGAGFVVKIWGAK